MQVETATVDWYARSLGKQEVIALEETKISCEKGHSEQWVLYRTVLRSIPYGTLRNEVIMTNNMSHTKRNNDSQLFEYDWYITGRYFYVSSWQIVENIPIP